MEAGGNIVDFHSCDFFPQDWFDLIVVLRSDNSILYPRLEKRYTPISSHDNHRNYSQKKISENIQCEIMQVVLEEAHGAYAPDIIQELQSNTIEDMEENVERICTWVNMWVENNND